MSEDIEEYWERSTASSDEPIPVRVQKAKPPPTPAPYTEVERERLYIQSSLSRIPSEEEHLDPTRIEGARYLNVVDRMMASDYFGHPCRVFAPRWFEVHRWFWWLFIANSWMSGYEWTAVGKFPSGFVRAIKEKPGRSEGIPW
jgi:hypothetical protein